MKTKAHLHPEAKGILIGSAAGIIAFIFLSMIAALILTKSDIAYHTIKYVCFGAVAVSSFFAGYIGKKRTKLKGITAGLLASSVLVVTVFTILIIANHGSFGEDAYLLIPSGLLFGMLGGIISSNLR